MEETITSPVTERCAIVTGANKGIGFEICRQLAGNGVTVVLTARDEKRGVEAIEKLNVFGLSDRVIFHQLDVTDPTSVASLVEFIKARFGKIDILINNAGITGAMLEGDILVMKEFIEEYGFQVGAFGDSEPEEIKSKEKGTIIDTYELAEQCLQTNYYGVKRMTEAFIPLLQLSDSPRTVNMSSFMGKLQLLSNEWAASVLSDVENLTEERVDEVLNEFLKDFKEASLEAKNWPVPGTSYKLSKAVVNAYTRIIAKKYPTICTNCVCPGYVRTDMTGYTGRLSAVKLALMPDAGPSGLFFLCQEVSSF